MKIATWNVNSLAARLPRVIEFLGQHAPDVVLMQETKCKPAAFPVDDLAAAGYHAVHHSAGRWAGVAIVARQELELTAPVSGLPGELLADEARWIEATAGGLRVVSAYVPNGRAIDTPTFTEKLTFLEAGRLVDAYRHVHPDDQQLTWWDYRQGAFHRGMGLRIDYLLASENLAPRLEHCGIERNYRKGAKPSAHAPLVAVLGA
jgi:exodeoxyribonuclease-3